MNDKHSFVNEEDLLGFTTRNAAIANSRADGRQEALLSQRAQRVGRA